MANNKMLIDASHPEETRVVALRGNRVEEFDFEAANKKQLRGNIYLAKVTRVEPSLQAAFVDYGGNRHGFLAFSEIHPDYYQIPVADRQALLAEEAAEHEEEESEEQRRPQRRRRRRDFREGYGRKRAEAEEAGAPLAEENGQDVHRPASIDAPSEEDSAYAFFSQDRFSPYPAFDESTRDASSETVFEIEAMAARDAAEAAEGFSAAPRLEAIEASHDGHPHDGHPNDEEREWGAPRRAAAKEAAADDSRTLAVDHEGYALIEEDGNEEDEDEEIAPPDHEMKARALDARSALQDFETPAPSEDDEEEDDDEEEEEEEEEIVEQIGGDAMEEMPRRQPRMRRRYKIQEVIKRRQVLLVQVVKEERGNKGAALTTYLSLAGRYSVLMPNTARGGGISRKITDLADRKRMKEIAQDLEVPEGMGVILRTAGASRTRAEVKRDFEYLLRMWETVRETTLRSSAPTLVYEEGSLIKRAIRDLYSKEIEEIVVAGEQGYREAKDFMRLLMPSHARCVRPWREAEALFVRHGVESQLDAMFSSQVTLRSGGYLVINQTEALVAIDVNSGRSTREHNIEDTALRTNLEAAEEIARQLRLRDLAGLIVVDFIDMEEPRNNRAVERKLKEALKNDRARIQVGRISHFGLLEMSRQRIRSGVLEGSTVACSHCMGTGAVRSTSSIALHVLRVLEEALMKSASHNIMVKTRTNVALYILNQKRNHLKEIEQRFGVEIYVIADDTLTGSTYHAFERGELATGVAAPQRTQAFEAQYDEEPEEALEDSRLEDDESFEASSELANGELSEEEAEGQRRRRRRRRRRGKNGAIERDPIALLEAPQPSDEGLARVAEAIGEFPAREAPKWGEPSEGFWANEDSGEASGFDAPRVVAPPPPLRLSDDAPASSKSNSESNESAENEKEPDFRAIDASPILADERDFGAAPPEAHNLPVESAHAAAQGEAPAPVEAAPEADDEMAEAEESQRKHVSSTPELVITEADPAKPKKGGWWQRARATFSGS